LLYGLLALIATVTVLWMYNRRENRRKHAVQLSSLMNQWGLTWFAGVYEDYAVGDYSGLVHRIREIIQAVRSDEVMVSKLWEATLKVGEYVAKNDPTKADELRKKLTAAVTTATSAVANKPAA
jgi:sulfite reductase beta subunit-like hemoprotein